MHLAKQQPMCCCRYGRACMVHPFVLVCDLRRYTNGRSLRDRDLPVLRWCPQAPLVFSIFHDALMEVIFAYLVAMICILQCLSVFRSCACIHMMSGSVIFSNIQDFAIYAWTIDVACPLAAFGGLISPWY